MNSQPPTTMGPIGSVWIPPAFPIPRLPDIDPIGLSMPRPTRKQIFGRCLLTVFYILTVTLSTFVAAHADSAIGQWANIFAASFNWVGFSKQAYGWIFRNPPSHSRAWIETTARITHDVYVQRRLGVTYAWMQDYREALSRG